MKDGARLIQACLADPSKWKTENVVIDSAGLRTTLKQRFEQFAFVQIVLAGLADGINPCAIATMIFLISFLATQKRKRIEVLAIGLSFTAAVYLTYLLIGLGAFKALTLLKQYYWISKAVKWAAVAFAGIVGLICFWDAIMYKLTGNVKEVKIQLPKALKLRIHGIISGNLKRSGLFVGAITAGFLVTLLEAVCTGQVYIPTIILMTRQEGLRLAGWLYLLFYNFLFVLPLLIIMVMAYYGLRWDQLAKSTQRNLPLLKTIMGVVLIGLAVFLAVAS
jgi:cytochrome c biogenesis protein CcdA